MKKQVNRSLVLWVVLMAAAGCTRYYQGMPSDHFDGRNFHNPGEPMKKGLASFLKWRFTAEKQPWPRYSELASYDKPPSRVEGGSLRVAYVGHATVLIQTQGLNILTDPIWAERASPFQWAGPRRVHPPGIKFEELPAIDVVLISHNHYDHLDLVTIEQLWQRDSPRIIVPLGNDTIITNHNPAIRAEALDWGDRVRLAKGITVNLDPIHHWSARGMFDRNRALWAAFTITTQEGNIYFAGDTGYGEGKYFRAAKDKYGSFRLAILPIGDYEPRWFMAYGHMNPEECIRSFEDLGMPMVVPIHYKVFQLADTAYDQPLRSLEMEIQRNKAAQGKFVPLMVGESSYIP